MIAGIVIGIISVALCLLAFSPFILAGKISLAEEHAALVAHLHNRLADSNERERLLGEELKKYTEMAKGDCKACMVRRGIVSSERELEIEAER